MFQATKAVVSYKKPRAKKYFRYKSCLFYICTNNQVWAYGSNEPLEHKFGSYLLSRNTPTVPRSLVFNDFKLLENNTKAVVLYKKENAKSARMPRVKQFLLFQYNSFFICEDDSVWVGFSSGKRYQIVFENLHGRKPIKIVAACGRAAFLFADKSGNKSVFACIGVFPFIDAPKLSLGWFPVSAAEKIVDVVLENKTIIVQLEGIGGQKREAQVFSGKSCHENYLWILCMQMSRHTDAISFWCQSIGCQSMAPTQRRSNNSRSAAYFRCDDGAVWKWEHGKLACLGKISVSLPCAKIKKIITKHDRVFIIHKDGNIKAAGSNDSYQLGIGVCQSGANFTLVKNLKGKKVFDIIIGPHHTLFLCEHGVLGCGDELYGYDPSPIPRLIPEFRAMAPDPDKKERFDYVFAEYKECDNSSLTTTRVKIPEWLPKE